MKKMILFAVFFCFVALSSAKAEWLCPELNTTSMKKNSNNSSYKYTLKKIRAEIFVKGSLDKTKGYSPYGRIVFQDMQGKKLFEHNDSASKFFLLFDGYPSFCIGTYEGAGSNGSHLVMFLTVGYELGEYSVEYESFRKKGGFKTDLKNKKINYNLKVFQFFPSDGYWEVVYEVFTVPMRYDQAKSSEKALLETLSSMDKNIQSLKDTYASIAKGDKKKANSFFAKSFSKKQQAKMFKENKKCLLGIEFFTYLGWGSGGRIDIDYYKPGGCNLDSVFLESGKIEEAFFNDQY